MRFNSDTRDRIFYLVTFPKMAGSKIKGHKVSTQDFFITSDSSKLLYIATTE
jgi:hypothetical protein